MGAIGSGAYYFNKYVGGEVIFASHPDGKNDGLYSASRLVRSSALPMQNFTLFAHGLVGGARLADRTAKSRALTTSPISGDRL